jgi:hypothetical protein
MIINDIETDYKAKKLWDGMSPEIRVKFVTYFQFWDGFSNYLYEYLPEDLKDRLRLKITQNYPYWL